MSHKSRMVQADALIQNGSKQIGKRGVLGWIAPRFAGLLRLLPDEYRRGGSVHGFAEMVGQHIDQLMPLVAKQLRIVGRLDPRGVVHERLELVLWRYQDLVLPIASGSMLRPQRAH